jgi:hypothetical protein
MNKARRTLIASEVLAVRTAIENLRFALSNLQDIANAEQECYDNMPEGLQNSDQGERILDCAQALELNVDDMDTAISSLGDAIDGIEEAAGQ